ncbi:phosphate ABC transporter permease PstA [Kribbia dieselivorans]|uniref:phosphate ABC transporter permease PstA n=1 Tax=Kribbia dieselivorans TaxID=331526 RepID=UPI000838BFF7|nr:phosphate ABC transporter permease PstA [Kribbia dieselivorans]
MSATDLKTDPAGPAGSTDSYSSIKQPTLSPAVRLGIFIGAVVVGFAVVLGLSSYNTLAVIIVAALVYMVVIYIASRIVEGQRHAVDRLVTGMVTTFFLLALVPLVSVAMTVISEGYKRIDGEFFTSSMRGVIGAGGGIMHALQGTLIITLITSLISIPIGIFAAIYLVEYGNGNRISRALTFFVDVMTGIPSIVAGLFAVALFASLTGDAGFQAGIVGSIALSVLMIPVVVRNTEEMLRLVPNELREASYALGVPKWLTISKVVLPTAIAGIATGVTLAIARVIGETAPLLITAGYIPGVNLNPFSGQMTTLPVFSYNQYMNRGIPPEAYVERAWSAALVLIVVVMILNVLARMISKYFAPKTGR